MFDTLDRIVIAVSDLARAQRDAVALLGRSPSWVGGHPEHGARNLIFRLANTSLEFVSPESRGALADSLRERLDTEGEGLYGIALGTDDADACAKQLGERGIRVGAPEPGLTQDGPSGAWRRFKSFSLPLVQTGGIRLIAVQHLSLPEEMPPSLPLGDASAAVSALDHVVILSQQADRSKDLYESKLGIRLALDKEFADRKTRILFFRVGGATIEIGSPLAPGDDAPPGDDRLWGVAHRVPDVDLARERIIAAGLDVTAVRNGFKPRTRVCTVKNGTCGVPTLLIQPAPRDR